MAIKKFKDSEGKELKLALLLCSSSSSSCCQYVMVIHMFYYPLLFTLCIILIVFVIFVENEDVKRTTLRELKVLRMLKQENIVELRFVSNIISSSGGSRP